MNCVFRAIEDGLWKCVACGYVTKKPYPSAPVRPCRESKNCRHLGDELRREECPTCDPTYKISLKVLACSIHGECTIGKQLDGLACCATCPDYSPR